MFILTETISDASFAGWHSCALAVDLDPSVEPEASDSDEEEGERSDMPGSFRETSQTEHQAPVPPPNFRGRVLRGGHRPFVPIGLRRGYPLRGMNRGNGPPS